jgi:hypothetical protein
MITIWGVFAVEMTLAAYHEIDFYLNSIWIIEFIRIELSVLQIFTETWFLGIYVFEGDCLGSLSYSKTFSDLLYPASPRGVLNALAALPFDSLMRVSQTWSSESCDTLRNFVLDFILAKCKAMLRLVILT